MLIKITVENFKSFDAETEMTMITSSKIRDTKTLNHRVKVKNTSVLKNAVIYGANASGKSNLVEAFRFIKLTLKYGLPLDCTQLFCKNKEENEQRESSFELQFSVGDSFYAYGFSVILSKRSLCGEWLYELCQNGSAKKIFERTENEKMSINDVLKLSEVDRQRMSTYIDDFGESSNTLFLTEMNRNKKYEISSELYVFKKVYDWLQTIS